ncbi:linear amide C-N hydrolase [Pseudoalteromonas sp. JBTF-M23]|uniref:Linear amide C-N hydrolase n=1 Tax=Pseudoalteromonas caenipelagi TaxID=2726988 RepID=A0A849VKM2_9GAMM|nr:linear amide C-N hydrolase [Pseudoalteromonas caenipelagi]NOU52251.1 linear amide C-N hydrolase [Pseudoalteromonas caenipelagi]
MCTNFVITTETSSKEKIPFTIPDAVIVGRTMEFGNQSVANGQVTILPKGEQLYSYGKTKAHHKYCIVGVNINVTTDDNNDDGYVAQLLGNCLSDGMNEEGLTCGSLWLPGSEYLTTEKIQDNDIPVYLFTNWVLGNFSSTEEVEQAVNSRDYRFFEVAKLPLPLHFPITDKSGKSIVIEFSSKHGTPCVYNNELGVLTNAPTYPEQLANLNAMLREHKFSPYNPPQIACSIEAPQGEGYGLAGLPGDPVPASRFVKTAVLKQFATDAQAGYKIKNAADAKTLAYHLINSVDLPKGVTRYGDAHLSEGSDYTQWVVVKDLSHGEFQIRKYDSPIPYKIDFDTISQLDLTAPMYIDVPKDVDALPLIPNT